GRPPRSRAVVRPCLFRPPAAWRGTTGARSGAGRVRSSKVATDIPRRPGVVGLYCLIAICKTPYGPKGRFPGPAPARPWPLEPLENLDFLAGRHGDRRLLAIAGPPHVASPAPQLPTHPGGVHLADVHIEDGLDGLLDLGLVGPRVHLEDVLALGHEGGTLFSNPRADHHIAGVHQPSTSSTAATASRVMSILGC